ADTVQFGIDVPHPLIVGGLPAMGRPLLERLDGIRTDHDIFASLIEDRVDTTDGAEPAALLERLVELGIVVDGGRWPGNLSVTGDSRDRLLPDVRAASAFERWRHEPAGRWDALRRAHVTVAGASRLGATLGRTLAAAGVGRIDIDDPRQVTAADVSIGGFAPSDIGRFRADPLATRPPSTTGQRGRGAGRRLVIVTDAVDPHRRCRLLSAAGTVHLVVSCQEQIGRVGPLVEPGHTPCQFCLELTRRDIDAGWADIWRQQVATATPDADALLVGITAGIAAMHAVEWLTDGQPPSLGAFVEVLAPHGAATLRRITRHPECGCAWPDGGTSPTMAK
ncbi:MAG: ThiF family adenylyltransferase, partial [Actinomycetia bacterium]|nr:ThiF family adenylyltransferase [Actinomycetes bacterium]